MSSLQGVVQTVQERYKATERKGWMVKRQKRRWPHLGSLAPKNHPSQSAQDWMSHWINSTDLEDILGWSSSVLTAHHTCCIR